MELSPITQYTLAMSVWLPLVVGVIQARKVAPMPAKARVLKLQRITFNTVAATVGVAVAVLVILQ